MRARLAALAVAALLAIPAWGVQPDEILPDPALEARAREITKGIRCLVCRNESIDDSNADLARDLRLLVRERLVAGDSDAEVETYLVDRYGEFVLLKPPLTPANAALWAAGPIIFLAGLAAAWGFLRRRRSQAPAVADRALSPAEQAALERLLRE